MAIRGRKTNLNYIMIFLKTNLTKLQSQAKSMIPGIDRENILTANIPLPPLEEQERIVEKIKSLNNLIDNLFKFTA